MIFKPGGHVPDRAGVGRAVARGQHWQLLNELRNETCYLSRATFLRRTAAAPASIESETVPWDSNSATRWKDFRHPHTQQVAWNPRRRSSVPGHTSPRQVLQNCGLVPTEGIVNFLPACCPRSAHPCRGQGARPNPSASLNLTLRHRPPHYRVTSSPLTGSPPSSATVPTRSWEHTAEKLGVDSAHVLLSFVQATWVLPQRLR